MSSAPLPQQRHYPGEGQGKCNPERDARAPMFSSQVDPPPERPWPATSDEGNSVPAPVPRRPMETTSADDAQRPWTVLVESGRVVGRYRAEDTHSAGAEATRISLDGTQVDVYEVDARQCSPPQVGECVDPVALGWVKV